VIRYLLERLIWSAATVLGMSLAAFFLVALAPGDPITAELRFMGISAKPETVDALRREYDLDAPIPYRYLRWLGRLARMDLGTSIASGRKVQDELKEALPSTMTLAGSALTLIVILSWTVGVISARTSSGITTRLLRFATVLAVSIPSWWLALAVLSVVTLAFGWRVLADPDSAANLAFAASLLAIGPGLSISRVVKQKIEDESLEDHVRLAAAIGLSPMRILITDIGRIIAPALVTIWATTFGYLLGGSVVIERIFDRPGLGNLALQAIGARDYPVLQGYLLLAGTLFVACNWLADAVSAWADPRLRSRGVHR
jgi:ABC-type dipeptide/oligopeptide/nickel transport system permease component